MEGAERADDAAADEDAAEPSRIPEGGAIVLEVMDPPSGLASAGGSARSETVPAGDSTYSELSWKIEAIMAQHAEDCKRMLPSHAAAFARRALDQLQPQPAPRAAGRSPRSRGAGAAPATAADPGWAEWVRSPFRATPSGLPPTTEWGGVPLRVV